MGSVRSAAHVLDLQGYAKGLKLTLEFRSVVCPDLGGIPKNLKHFFSNSISNGFATLVFDQSKYTKLTKTTNGT
jgi:hypothetical protein